MIGSDDGDVEGYNVGLNDGDFVGLTCGTRVLGDVVGVVEGFIDGIWLG